MDEHTIYKFTRSGQIPSIKITGQGRLKEEIIDKWIEHESIQMLKEGKNEKS